MIYNGTTLKTLNVSFSALFSGGLGQVTGQKNVIAQTVPSSTKMNEYAWLGELPDMREWLGDRQRLQLKGHAYSIENKDFELTVEVKKTDIEDDNIGGYSMMFTAMGRSIAAHPEKLVWGALANGHTSPCYDGQNFFDTDHPVLDANGNVQSVSNSLPGAGTPWFLIDDSQAVKPLIYQERKAPVFVAMDSPENPETFNRNTLTYGGDYRANVGYGFWQFAVRSQAALDHDGLEAAMVAMANFTGDHGRKIGASGKTLIVPRNLERAARKLLMSETKANGETNEYQNAAKLAVIDWL
jgi:phage major head subunit gpT-like protein